MRGSIVRFAKRCQSRCGKALSRSRGDFLRRLWLATKPKSQFDEPIEDEANPGEDENAPIEAEGLVLNGGRKMGFEDEEVE
jgi:hypothetical protein